MEKQAKKMAKLNVFSPIVLKFVFLSLSEITKGSF